MSNQVKEQLLYDLAKELKNNYKINQNIANHLTDSEKAQLLCTLEKNDAVVKLTNLLIAKNKSLVKNNRIIGKQKSDLEKALKDEQEKKAKINIEVAQLRCEINELQSQILNSPNSLQALLLSDIVKRSEIINFLQELINLLHESS